MWNSSFSRNRFFPKLSFLLSPLPWLLQQRLRYKNLHSMCVYPVFLSKYLSDFSWVDFLLAVTDFHRKPGYLTALCLHSQISNGHWNGAGPGHVWSSLCDPRTCTGETMGMVPHCWTPCQHRSKIMQYKYFSTKKVSFDRYFKYSPASGQTLLLGI